MFSLVGSILEYWNNPLQVSQPIETNKVPIPAHVNLEIRKKDRTIIPLNELSASWASFFSRILLERTFFQNQTIPKETILYLANDLIGILSPPKQNTLSVTKELTILLKQFRGQTLTPEEDLYENSSKKIDVIGEILNGLSLSMTALIGQNLYSSLHSAIAQGLWVHIPAIVGYSSNALLGSRAVAFAVDHLLQKFKLSQEQGEQIKPWLNMMGRLILGFFPKVHATEKGVHYHYPSFEGHFQTFEQGQSTTLHGDFLSIDKEGILETPEGSFNASYSVGFKLTKIEELNEEQISFQVTAKDGKIVPIHFQRVEGEHGPEIQVVCNDEKLAEHWTQLLYPKDALTPKVNEDCSRDLALGALGSVFLQNYLPLTLVSLSCLQTLRAEQNCPNFDLRNPQSFFGQVISYQQASQRLSFLEEKIEKNEILSDADKEEFQQLEKLFSQNGCQDDQIMIKRDNTQYVVASKQTAQLALVQKFDRINSKVTILLKNPSLTLFKDLIIFSDSFLYTQIFTNIKSVMGLDFASNLEHFSHANSLLLGATSYLSELPDISNSIFNLFDQSNNLHLMQKNFILNCRKLLSDYSKGNQNMLSDIQNKVNNYRAHPNEKKYADNLLSIHKDFENRASETLTLCNNIEELSNEFSGKIGKFKSYIESTIKTISEKKTVISNLINDMAALPKVEENLKNKNEEIRKAEFAAMAQRMNANPPRPGVLAINLPTDNTPLQIPSHLLQEKSNLDKDIENIKKRISEGSKLIPKINLNDTKKNLEKASSSLDSAVIKVQEITLALNRKTQQLTQQKELIKQEVNRIPTSIKLDSMEEWITLLENMLYHLLSLRYTLHESDVQIQSIDKLFENEKKIRNK